MIEDYSMHPNTICTRRCYHKKSAKAKKKIFARQEEIKQAKITEGKCRSCGKKREREDITYCNDCNAKMAKRIKKYKVRNAINGRCCKCPNPADGDSSHCRGCKEKARLAMWVRRHHPRMNENTGKRYD